MLTERRIPPTREIIRNFASAIVQESVSESWVTRFIDRQQDQFTPRWTTAMDANRHAADSSTKYKLYFELLQHKIAEYNVDAEHTYNMDEKGFMIGITGRSKRVFSRRMWEKKEVRATLQDASPWVEQVFDRYTKAKARRSYRLLILDGHGSHLTIDFIEYCDQNKILLAIFPPHSTHTLQPLDVVLFKPLSTAYAAELSSYLHRSQGLLQITKRDSFLLFWQPWVSSFKKETILQSFQATGIWPINPDVILQRFSKSDLDGQQSRENSTSILSGSEWRKFDRVRKEYHGGAVIWSPRKIREARARESVRECEEKELQLQKAERAELKKVAKLYKQQISKEKRVTRERAKVVREKEKAERAEEAAQRARDRQARNAEKGIQLSQNSKRKVSQPPTQKSKRQKLIVNARRVAEAVEAFPTAPAVTTRRGRNVTLPSKYR
ncbi:hypothetical protein AA0119_g12098 [Alternaria tenuissima]|uniref:HTH CENPB-type domain-containing protein n=1 Tax=Alternaria tenuissima TaxID=119927 RepID=A0ABY0FS76_9PLEO|nr:hypothetical protein AA0119_g12098 [Alternaria tenuissima]